MKFNSFLLSVCIIVFGCSPLLADEQGGLSPQSVSSASGLTQPSGGPDKYRVFLLRFISAQDGLLFLEEANIKTASALNDDKALLVTAQPDVLIKAAALLKLVDSNEKYAVRVLLPASEANLMPPMAQIEQQIETSGKLVSIGTFMNPPAGETSKIIIDIHDGKLLAVAPVSIMDELVTIAGQVKQASPAKSNAAAMSEKENILLQVGQSSESSSAEQPDKVFKELLDSIAQAEKALAGEKQTSQEKALTGEQADITDESEKPGEDIEKPSHADMAEPAQDVGDHNEPNYNPYEPQVIPNAEETLELALPEKLEIIPLLDLVGKYLNLNYVYNPQQLQGKEVHLKLQGKVKVGELYPLVESVLKFTGLAMTRKGNLVTIVPLADALEIDPVLIEADRGQVQAGDVVVTRIFHLEYADATETKNVLDGMRIGAVTALPGLGTLVVTGYAYRMSRVEELLEIIDKPGAPKKFRFRQLKYTLATNLAPKVKELVEQLGDMSIELAAATPTPTPVRGRRVPVRRPTPQPTQTTTASKPTVYLDSDERTNRILMIGNEEELSIVENLIDALDVAQQDIRSIRVYEIQHVGAEEVRKKLEELGIIGAERTTTTSRRGRITARPAVAPGQPAAAPSPLPAATGAEAALPTEAIQVVIIESTNSLMVNASPEQHAVIATIIAYVDSETLQQAIPYVVYPLENQNPEDLADVLNKLIQETVLDKEGKIQQVIQRQEDQIVIVPDESTFSLIVFASKKNQEWISNLISSLDKRRPQVLIDATLVEISEVDAFTYDLQLVSQFASSTKTLQGLENPLLPTFPSDHITEATSVLGDTGAGRGFYADRNIQALLKLMAKKGYGRVLAKPKILVNDNEKGHIDTTSTIYVARSASTVYTTATTPSGEAPISTSYTFDQFPSGIALDITPHISEGNLLRLEITMTRSSQVPPQGGLQANQAPPDKTENNVETVVTVPDNSTIILGGILTLDQSKENWKVPLLGDIPLVGGLFRSINNSSTRSKLYVFVKANILRPGTDATSLANINRMSDKNRAAFEKSETDIQNFQDWPGIKPKPMEPVHVLDAE